MEQFYGLDLVKSLSMKWIKIEREMKNHVLESGQIIVTSLELEELSEEGKGLITSTHGGSRG